MKAKMSDQLDTLEAGVIVLVDNDPWFNHT